MLAGVLSTACVVAIASDPAPRGVPELAASPLLTITHCSHAGGCTTLDLQSPEPSGRHQLEESPDLRRIMAELERRHFPATAFVTADDVNRNALRITELFGEITTTDAKSLLLLKQEEKLARDVYQALFTKWSHATFAHIADLDEGLEATGTTGAGPAGKGPGGQQGGKAQPSNGGRMRRGREPLRIAASPPFWLCRPGP